MAAVFSQPRAVTVFPLNDTALHHQVNGFVVDAAVVMDPAAIVITRVIVRAGHSVRVTIRQWITHTAERTQA